MKAVWLLILIIIGAVLFVVFGPDIGLGKSKANTPQPTTPAANTSVAGQAGMTGNTAQAGGTTHVGTPITEVNTTTGIMSDLQSFGGYASGHTPVMIKRRQQNKLNDLQDAQNKRIEEQLGQ